jgi:hypothetical protein
VCTGLTDTNSSVVLLKLLSKPDGSQPTKSHQVKSQDELDALLSDETFNKRETIQLIELMMPRGDVPRALKVQAELVSSSTAWSLTSTDLYHGYSRRPPKPMPENKLAWEYVLL